MRHRPGVVKKKNTMLWCAPAQPNRGRCEYDASSFSSFEKFVFVFVFVFVHEREHERESRAREPQK